MLTWLNPSTCWEVFVFREGLLVLACVKGLPPVCKKSTRIGCSLFPAVFGPFCISCIEICATTRRREWYIAPQSYFPFNFFSVQKRLTRGWGGGWAQHSERMFRNQPCLGLGIVSATLSPSCGCHFRQASLCIFAWPIFIFQCYSPTVITTLSVFEMWGNGISQGISVQCTGRGSFLCLGSYQKYLSVDVCWEILQIRGNLFLCRGMLESSVIVRSDLTWSNCKLDCFFMLNKTEEHESGNGVVSRKFWGYICFF